jgi:hypothetical protein
MFIVCLELSTWKVLPHMEMSVWGSARSVGKPSIGKPWRPLEKLMPSLHPSSAVGTSKSYAWLTSTKHMAIQLLNKFVRILLTGKDMVDKYDIRPSGSRS